MLRRPSSGTGCCGTIGPVIVPALGCRHRFQSHHDLRRGIVMTAGVTRKTNRKPVVAVLLVRVWIHSGGFGQVFVVAIVRLVMLFQVLGLAAASLGVFDFPSDLGALQAVAQILVAVAVVDLVGALAVVDGQALAAGSQLHVAVNLGQTAGVGRGALEHVLVQLVPVSLEVVAGGRNLGQTRYRGGCSTDGQLVVGSGTGQSGGSHRRPERCFGTLATDVASSGLHHCNAGHCEHDEYWKKFDAPTGLIHRHLLRSCGLRVSLRNCPEVEDSSNSCT